jgi:hypothetical protein
MKTIAREARIEQYTEDSSNTVQSIFEYAFLMYDRLLHTRIADNASVAEKGFFPAGKNPFSE